MNTGAEVAAPVHRRSLREVFAVPAAVAVVSLVGLVAALVGDGLWDVVSWVSLGFAVGLAGWHALPWRRARPAR